MSYTPVPFPGGASPMQQYAQIPGQLPATSPGQSIHPGSITYTTTVGSNGQVVYNPFRAVPASYQTSSGVVNGIQWVPAEATSVLPAGAVPATQEMIATFGRQPATDQSTYDWQYEEDRRRRKEEKDRKAWDRERRERERGEDKEYRRAEAERLRRVDREEEKRYQGSRKNSSGGDMYGGYQREPKYNSGTGDLERRFEALDMDRKDRDRDREYERERDRAARSRRGSMYGDRPVVPPNPYPAHTPSPAFSTTATAGYAAVPYGPPPGASPYQTAGGVYGSTSPAGSIQRPISPYQAPIAPRAVSPSPYAAAPRPISPYYGASAPRPVSPYHGGGGLPQRSISPYHGAGLPQRPVSPYYAGAVPGRPVSPYHGVVASARPVSPYHAPRPITPIPGAPGVYPPGHVMEGKPIRQSNLSRAASPAPGAVGYGTGSYPTPAHSTSPPTSQQMLAAPEGFSRPLNAAQPYTPFEIIKIQDMDDFFENIPRMPLVLVTHDVYHEDWIRLMTDLNLAWSGRLPVPEYAADGHPPKRQTLTADLVDLWNASFFSKRGVELVLYKGRERRSGRDIGSINSHLPGFENLGFDTDSEEDTEDSEGDDSAEDRYKYGAYGGVYGRQVEGQMAELHEARRLRRERRRAEKKRRRQEKKHMRKLRDAERKYAIYLTCVPPRDSSYGAQY